MQNITYRRAQNSDSEVIKNILEEAFEEYEINRMHLETTSRFVQAVGLYGKSGFTKNADAILAPGHDIGLMIDL